MAHKLLDGVSAIGVSPSVKISKEVLSHTLDTSFIDTGATKISAVTVIFQGSNTNEDAETGVITDPAIAIGSTAERVANGAFAFQIDNVSYAKTAVVAGSVFTAAHKITASKWGAINIYINAAGTIVTKINGDQTGTLSFDTAAEAIADVDLVETTSDLAKIGRVLINNDASLWTANTDDLTDASDVTTATFMSDQSSFSNLNTTVFSAGDITDKRHTDFINDQHQEYVRAYLSVLTGTGEVTARYTPVENRTT